MLYYKSNVLIKIHLHKWCSFSTPACWLSECLCKVGSLLFLSAGFVMDNNADSHFLVYRTVYKYYLFHSGRNLVMSSGETHGNLASGTCKAEGGSGCDTAGRKMELMDIPISCPSSQPHLREVVGILHCVSLRCFARGNCSHYGDGELLCWASITEGVSGEAVCPCWNAVLPKNSMGNRQVS